MHPVGRLTGQRKSGKVANVQKPTMQGRECGHPLFQSKYSERWNLVEADANMQREPTLLPGADCIPSSQGDSAATNENDVCANLPDCTGKVDHFGRVVGIKFKTCSKLTAAGSPVVVVDSAPSCS